MQFDQLAAFDRCSVHTALITLAKLVGLSTFVETGTYEGSTILALHNHFSRLVSVELSSVRYAHSCAALRGINNVQLFNGPSGLLLPNILEELQITRALFWLDAHGNEGDLSSPNQVPEELEAIRHFAPESIAVIDDVVRRDGELFINNAHKLTWPSFWQSRHFPSMCVQVLWRNTERR